MEFLADMVTVFRTIRLPSKWMTRRTERPFVLLNSRHKVISFVFGSLRSRRENGARLACGVPKMRSSCKGFLLHCRCTCG